MAPSWSCECCCESFSDYTSVNIDGDFVCVKCVRQMFDKALEFEHDYPPKWAGPLHPVDFSHILDLDYVKDYMAKEIEYKTPPSRRVYCQYDLGRVKLLGNDESEYWTERCGEYVGARREFVQDGILVLGRCRGLHADKLTCMVCEHYCNDNAEDMLQHICEGKSPATGNRAQAFLGLVRGKDWQQCPAQHCERPIELSEACNHITCQCGMGFCFICGKEADGDSDHWRKGGCPRYNQPGDANVEYDNYDEDDENDRVSHTGEHDEEGSEADVLENVRDLFEIDELLPTPAISPTLAMAIDAQRRWAAAVSRVRRPIGMGEQLAADVVDQHADPRSAEVEEEPEIPELVAIAPNDAQAIANAFLEDDISDGDHHAFPSPNPLGNPVVTTEEADIDQALWRMAVE